jgi:hypothetical protein
MSGIYLVREDGSLAEMSETPYESEDLLQQLLATYPQLLAGEHVDADSRSRWLLITREVGVPDREAGSDRWSLDHLFLDRDGVPTLVEVKRSTDTRIRREVIGQMLDYAANAVVYWPIETIQAAFALRCQKDRLDPAKVLQDFLGQRDAAEFWQSAKTNLQARRVRMIFVADVIPQELRRVVEFLNEQMDPAEVLALEVRQYIGEGKLKSLIPRLIGRTEQAQQKKAAGSTDVRQWDEKSFFDVLNQRGDEKAADVARALLDWGKRTMTTIWWGKGKVAPSFVPFLTVKDDDYYPINVSTGFKNAQVQLGFAHMTVPPFDTPEGRRPFLERLGRIPGVGVEDDWASRYPSIPLSVLASDGVLKEFLQVLDWSVDRVKEVNSL